MGGYSALLSSRCISCKKLVSVLEEIGWALRPLWMDVDAREYLAAAGFEPGTVHPVASQYADPYLIIGRFRPFYRPLRFSALEGGERSASRPGRFLPP
jgi:hypothetical protein